MTPSTWAGRWSVTAGAVPGAAAYADLPTLVAGLDDGAEVPAVVVLPVLPPGDDPVAETHRVTVATLAFLQGWLAEPRFDAARLLVLTSGTAPAAGAVRGLVRAAQTEHPGRFLLADVEDPGTPGLGVLLELVEENEFAVRGGTVLAPRLARVAASPAEPAESERGPWGDGTVLITGASGSLAGFVARHLVSERGVRSVLLSRPPRAGRARDGGLAGRVDRGRCGGRGGGL
ncbi:SpnB-like Rossmann fold domain-containing protein [Streptomyces lasalocidi]